MTCVAARNKLSSVHLARGSTTMREYRKGKGSHVLHKDGTEYGRRVLSFDQTLQFLVSFTVIVFLLNGNFPLIANARYNFRNWLFELLNGSALFTSRALCLDPMAMMN